MLEPDHPIHYLAEQVEHVLFGLLWRTLFAVLVVMLTGWLLFF